MIRDLELVIRHSVTITPGKDTPGGVGTGPRVRLPFTRIDARRCRAQTNRHSEQSEQSRFFFAAIR